MDEKNPWKDWRPEVEVIHNAIEAEVKEGREVLVVVHSLKALVASEAMEGFDPASVQLMIITGHMFDPGQSFITTVGGLMPPIFDVKV